MAAVELLSIPYITLWVNAFDACLGFYRDILGLPLEHSEENFAQFATKGTKLYLHRLGGGEKLRNHTVEIHFDVQDVDEVYIYLQSKGVVFEEAPANRPWGVRMASFRDPEGFSLEIIGPLKAASER